MNSDYDLHKLMGCQKPKHTSKATRVRGSYYLGMGP